MRSPTTTSSCVRRTSSGRMLEPLMDRSDSSLSHARTEEEDDEQRAHTHTIMATNAPGRTDGLYAGFYSISRTQLEVTQDVHGPFVAPLWRRSAHTTPTTPIFLRTYASWRPGRSAVRELLLHRENRSSSVDPWPVVLLRRCRQPLTPGHSCCCNPNRTRAHAN